MPCHRWSSLQYGAVMGFGVICGGVLALMDENTNWFERLGSYGDWLFVGPPAVSLLFNMIHHGCSTQLQYDNDFDWEKFDGYEKEFNGLLTKEESDDVESNQPLTTREIRCLQLCYNHFYNRSYLDEEGCNRVVKLDAVLNSKQRNMMRILAYFTKKSINYSSLKCVFGKDDAERNYGHWLVTSLSERLKESESKKNTILHGGNDYQVLR